MNTIEIVSKEQVGVAEAGYSNKSVQDFVDMFVLREQTLKTYSNSVRKWCDFFRITRNEIVVTPERINQFVMERRNDNGDIPKYSTVMAHLSGVVKYWNLLDIDVQMARLGVTTEEEKRSNDISIQESVDLAKPIVKKRCLENNKETKQHISITPEEVLEMMKLSNNNATKRECDNIRNCALIAACFIGAFRVHELVSIKLEDIQEASRKDGYNITVTQKGGSKVTKLIPRRKANGEESPYFNAIQRWLEYRNTIEGAFDNDYLFVAISRGNAIVSKNPMTIRAAQKNISPYFPADCSFHSFRVGFVTYAKSLELTNRQIMQQTGHKSERMIDYYNRPHESEETNAVNQF